VSYPHWMNRDQRIAFAAMQGRVTESDADEVFADDELSGAWTLEAPDEAFEPEEPYEGPTCSICDGLGHGYPGAGPCPLEDDGRFEDDPRERWLS